MHKMFCSYTIVLHTLALTVSMLGKLFPALARAGPELLLLRAPLPESVLLFTPPQGLAVGQVHQGDGPLA